GPHEFYTTPIGLSNDARSMRDLCSIRAHGTISGTESPRETRGVFGGLTLVRSLGRRKCLPRACNEMLAKRIIPCLDVREGRVVKGVNFLNLRDAGDPVELAARYDRLGADELVFLDITASHERRDLIFDL